MAHNRKKIRGFWSYLLWLLLMSLIMAAGSRGEDRALLIGVGRYAQLEEKLNGVGLDLRRMMESAQLMGFKKQAIKVLAHEQADTASVYHTVENWLVKGTDRQDRVLIYFSGHGSQVPDENNDEDDNFDEVLLLYDATIVQKRGRQTLNGVLQDDRFNRMLAKMKSRNILVILDACHSGSATRSLRLTPRATGLEDVQVKYYYYSPMLEAAGGSGRFDVMETDNSRHIDSRYVAITACRDDEKTITTKQGSIFTLGLHHVLRSAANAGRNLTPEDLQRQTANFIQTRIHSNVVTFHPQIVGDENLRRYPIELVAVSRQDNMMVQQYRQPPIHKSHAILWIKPNKTCFEPGDMLEISVQVTEPGFLNVLSITPDEQATVLFPNQYHPHNAVSPGNITIPADDMGFEMLTDGPLGRHLIKALLTRTPLNAYKDDLRNPQDVMAVLPPSSTRSLMLRQKEDELAAGTVRVEVREAGQCK